MALSKLVQVENKSSKIVIIRNIEDRSRNAFDIMIGPNQNVVLSYNPNVPWASNEGQFNGNKRIEIQVGRIFHAIWQDHQGSDDRIRTSAGTINFANPKWSRPTPANRLSGLPNITGDNTFKLIVGEDEKLSGVRVDDNIIRPINPIENNKTKVWEVYHHLFKKHKQMYGITFGFSFHNELKGDWLMQTPNLWGHKGEAPSKHSDWFPEKIGKLISEAKQVVDILTLKSEPNGKFLEEIKSGIKSIARNNIPVVIRVLIGAHTTSNVDTAKLRNELYLAALNENRGWRGSVYVGSLRTRGIISWNHSKIVAIDGKNLIVGGHNMWPKDYLEKAPVHDVSMLVSGEAAGFAHQYANRLWRHLSHWNKGGVFSPIYSNSWEFITQLNSNESLPEVHPEPYKSEKKVSVLNLGTLGLGIDDSNRDHGWEGMLYAISLATKSIKLSQQDLIFEKGPIYQSPADLFQALAKVIINNNVQVSIILSTPGATSGGGTGYSWDVSLKRAADSFINDTKGVPNMPTGEKLKKMLDSKLHITTLRFSDDKQWPEPHYPRIFGKG